MSERTFGKYALVHRIGIGGMAEVFEGRLSGAAGFSKRLAIKLLLPELQSERRVVDMFIDEASIAAGLNHPNIVHVFDFGEIDGSYFMAMEYVDGWDLRKLCSWSRQSGRPFPVAAAVRIVAQLCRALDYIHNSERQIVHRDVTPHNVFVARHGAVKLGDFGIARAEARRSRTEDGQIKGKLAYLAPEQVRGDPVTVQTDVYAAGLILYELLAGRQLIDGERDVDLLKVALDPPEAKLAHVRPQAATLEPIVQRALRSNVKLRYPTAALMAQDLERYLKSDSFSPDELAAFASNLEPSRHEVRADSVGEWGGGAVVARHAPRFSKPAHATTQLGSERGEPRAPWRLALIATGLALAAVVAVAVVHNAPSQPTPKRAAKPVEAVVDASVTPVADSAVAQKSADARVVVAEPKDLAVAAVLLDVRSRKPIRRRPRPIRRRPRKSSKVVSPAAPLVKAASKGPSTAVVNAQLKALLKLARSRGLWPGDGPLASSALKQVRQDLRRDRADRAAATVSKLERAVQSFQINRQFVERKLARLESRIKRSNPAAAKRQQLTALSQRILGLIMDRRLIEASRLISQAMARVR